MQQKAKAKPLIVQCDWDLTKVMTESDILENKKNSSFLHYSLKKKVIVCQNQ